MISMKRIPLTQGQFAMVSDEDYDYLMSWKWHCSKDQSGDYRAYTNRHIRAPRGTPPRYQNRPMSRIIMEIDLMEEGVDLVVDHVNHNTLDNRRVNLRVCTRQQNIWNSRQRAGGTGYRGVYNAKTKFLAKIGPLNLGTYTTAKDAALAYNKVCLEQRGEFAVLNEVA